ncbi:unnamed protein product [Lampetra planeri]
MSARFRLPAAGVHGGKPGEPSRDRDGVTVACSVSLLDGSRHVFAVNKQENAQMLLDYVCTYLQLAERDFFGLQIPGEGKAGPVGKRARADRRSASDLFFTCAPRDE